MYMYIYTMSKSHSFPNAPVFDQIVVTVPDSPPNAVDPVSMLS